MNKYESVIIMNPNINKEETSKAISSIKNKIGEYGKITKEVEIGLRKLAYEIKKNETGYYLSYEFEVDEEKKQDAIREIERFYRITDEIIKFITVKV